VSERSRSEVFRARNLDFILGSPGFSGAAVTVAVNRDTNGEASVNPYSKTGGECGIRTRGGGFAARSLQFTRVHRSSLRIRRWALAFIRVHGSSPECGDVAVNVAVKPWVLADRSSTNEPFASCHLTFVYMVETRSKEVHYPTLGTGPGCPGPARLDPH